MPWSSLALVTLIVALEETFGVQLPLDDFDIERFRSIDAMTAFLAEDRAPGGAGATEDEVAAVLSPRELDILRLAADGRDNDAIAAGLVLSVRTVERHLQNAYAKLGLHGRTARTAAVARLLSHT